jgi:hypothetical protein
MLENLLSLYREIRSDLCQRAQLPTLRLRYYQNLMRISLLFALALGGCSSFDKLHVTSYQTVTGKEASPWSLGCLVTVENRKKRYVGLNSSPCEHIGIGDRAAFLHDREVVFWINDKPFNVQSASLKK